MICTKSNHLCKKSERPLWFVTNPRISDSPRRANSPLCGERNCRTPRPHRGVRPPFLNWKFQSAEARGFEPLEPFRAQHISSVLLSTAQPRLHSSFFPNTIVLNALPPLYDFTCFSMRRASVISTQILDRKSTRLNSSH